MKKVCNVLFFLSFSYFSFASLALSEFRGVQSSEGETEGIFRSNSSENSDFCCHRQEKPGFAYDIPPHEIRSIVGGWLSKSEVKTIQQRPGHKGQK